MNTVSWKWLATWIITTAILSCAVGIGIGYLSKISDSHRPYRPHRPPPAVSVLRVDCPEPPASLCAAP